MLGALRQEIEGSENATKAWIGGERPKQRLCADQLIGKFLQPLFRHEEQAVLRKEFAAARDPNRFEEIGPLPEPFGERGSRVRGLIRRRAVDHDRQQIAVLWKSLVERALLLPPRLIARDQLAEIGIDAEMRGGIEARADCEGEIEQSHQQGVAARGIDDARGNLAHGNSAVAIGCLKTDRYTLPHAVLNRTPGRQGKPNFVLRTCLQPVFSSVAAARSGRIPRASRG